MRPLPTSLGAFTLAFALVPSALAQTLGIEVTRAATCVRKTENGDRISVMYRGTLASDGSQFDSSYERGSPFTFKLGAGQVIKGWDQGLLGMCIGEGRKLTIPPQMGYGSEGTGSIPPGSTLVFETELMGIAGVKAEPQPQQPDRPTIAKPSDGPLSTTAGPSETPSTTPTPTPSPAIPTSTPSAALAAKPAQATSTKASPMDKDDNGECHLLGSYALFVQGALGLLAVSSLVLKRFRESPRRPVKIWFFDVSKQVFGSVLLHLANILMSMLSSGKFDVATTTQATTKLVKPDEAGKQPNPCSFYLLNLAIDTTIGIPILVILLKLLHKAFAHTSLARPVESIRSGNYGHPPRATWWLKQSLIYFLGLLGMKLCVFAIFQLLPWIAWVGDWALRWTEGNEAIQITFVMFVFPLIMNAMQYWIIDGFIKDPAAAESRYVVAAGDESESEEDDDAWLERQRRGSMDSEREDPKEAGRRFGPGEYDPGFDGSGGSSRDEVREVGR